MERSFKITVLLFILAITVCGGIALYLFSNSSPQSGMTFNADLGNKVDHSRPSTNDNAVFPTLSAAMKAHGLREIYARSGDIPDATATIFNHPSTLTITLVPCQGDCTQHDDSGNGNPIQVDLPVVTNELPPAFYLHYLYSSKTQSGLVLTAVRVDPKAASVDQVADVVSHYAWAALDAHSAMVKAASTAQQNAASWAEKK